MDDAITRVDTMNNFPNVMKNLGIGAEDAQKSINKMSEKLKGLPTSLDAGARAVQRFTSKNEDVGKSTDMFLALNNALLAGGASADIQKSALEQISQAYAKGKPDMVEWRSLLTAMPAQANQLGKAFGMSSDELGEALRTGSISMDQFMDQVMKLNKQGVAGFDNFEVQARRATGGISTAVTNAKTAIVRGVGNIVNAFNKPLENTVFGSLSGLISGVGSKAESALTMVANLISGKISGFDFGNTIGQTITNVIIKIKENLPRIAQQGLNMVVSIAKGILQNASKIFSALTGLIRTIIDFIIKNLDKIIDLGLDLVIALAEGIGDNLDKIIGAVIKLIFAIMDKCSDPDTQKKMWTAAGKIIGALLKGIIKSIPLIINGMIRLRKKMIDTLKNMPKQMIENGKNLIKGLWQGMKDMKDWVIDKIKGLGKSILKGMKKVLGIKSPSKEFMKLGQYSIIGYYQGLHTKKTELNKALNNLSTNIQKQLKGKSTNYKNIGKLMGNELKAGLEASLKTVKETAQKFKETLSKVDLFSNNKLTDLSQVKQQITDYVSNLNQLKNKIPKDLYSQIMSMDRAEGLAYTDTLLSMNSNALKDYVNNWNDIQKISKKASNQWYESEAQSQAKAISDKYSKNLKTELSSLQTLMGKLGKNASKGLINGLLSQTKNLKGASKTMANNVINSLKKALKIKSPSRIMMELGEYTTQGYIEGIASMKSDLNKMMNDTFSLSPSMTGTMNNTLSPNVNVVNNVNVETDPLGQVVNKIKTFSGGAKNDYNYGFGG